MAMFVVQNSTPVFPLVFLGLKTPAFPLSLWLFISLAAGVCSSCLLQLLAYLQRGSTVQRRREAPRTAKEPERRETNRYTPPPPSREEVAGWEPEDEEWDIEEPPKEGTTTTSVRDSTEADRVNRTAYEAPQNPVNRPPSGVYSYSYRESDRSGAGKSETVYDANYRVITPPNSQRETTASDEEDWGFEEDEEDWGDRS